MLQKTVEQYVCITCLPPIFADKFKGSLINSFKPKLV
jgi:hypothetical protein